jgi:nitroreductase
VQTGAQAPTGHNAQRVEFSVVTDRKLIDHLDERIMSMFERMITLIDNPVGESLLKISGGKMGEMLLAGKDDIKRFRKLDGTGRLHVFRRAPVLIVAHSSPAALSGKEDCVIALSHIMLEAATHGLGACWIGYIVGAAKIDATLKKPLGVPSKNSLNAAMILGWPKYKYKRYIPRKAPHVKWLE